MSGTRTRLSLRGLVLLSAGVSATAASALLGEPDLVRLGLFAVALPLLDLGLLAALAATRPLAATVTRRVVPERPVRGEPLHVVLTATGVLGTWLREDLWTGSRRHVTTRAPRRSASVGDSDAEPATTLEYTLQPHQRGVLPLGPLSALRRSPLGLAEQTLVLDEGSEVVVVPRAVRLPPTALVRQPPGIGAHRRQRFGATSAEDAQVRPYVRGDDLRFVHWASTARRGSLQVRQGDVLRVPRTLLAVDGLVHGRGEDLRADLAASVGAHVLEHGHDLDVLVLGGSSVTGLGRGQLLDVLALAARPDPGRAASTWSELEQAVAHCHTGDLVVAVVAPQRADAPWPLLPEGALGVALVASPHGQVRDEHPVASGWRLVTAGDVDDLPALWEWLTRSLADRGAR